MQVTALQRENDFIGSSQKEKIDFKYFLTLKLYWDIE